MIYVSNTRYEIVPFEPKMITGTYCAKTGCGLFGQDCETCSWNTRTPYIRVAGEDYDTPYDYMNVQYFIVRNLKSNRIYFTTKEYVDNNFILAGN